MIIAPSKCPAEEHVSAGALSLPEQFLGKTAERTKKMDTSRDIIPGAKVIRSIMRPTEAETTGPYSSAAI